MAVVQHPVEDGGGGDRVSKDHAPFRYGAVAGDEETTALVAPRHQLEEQMGRLGLEWQVAELINDQQFRLGVGKRPAKSSSQSLVIP